MTRILAFSGKEEMLERLEGAFLRAGHEITAKLVAPDASIRDLVDVVERHEPDVVVYDVSPPLDVSALSWRRLSAQPSVRKLPLVVTTTSSHLPLNREEEAHVVVLREPFTPDQLLSALDHHPAALTLGRRRTSRAGPAPA